MTFAKSFRSLSPTTFFRFNVPTIRLDFKSSAGYTLTPSIATRSTFSSNVASFRFRPFPDTYNCLVCSSGGNLHREMAPQAPYGSKHGLRGNLWKAVFAATPEMLSHEVYKLEAVANPEILEYEAWATIGITVNKRQAHEAIDSILKHPAVYLASASLVRFNIVIAVRFHNTKLLSQFVMEELSTTTGISSVETFLYNKPLKYHNIHWYRILSKTAEAILS